MNQYSNNIDEEKILHAYNVDKLSIKKIAKKFRHDSNVVSRVITSRGIPIRTCTAYATHKYVEDFFDVIDSEEKAYWLGFLYADGSNCGGQISIELNSKDLNHLEKFKKAIAPDARITFCKKKRKFEYKEYCRLRVCHRGLSDQLIKLGCIPAKSEKVVFPSTEIVPTKLLKHFIRGYFDGDGSLKYNTATKTPGLTIIGTEQFLNMLQDVFEQHVEGYTRTKLATCGAVKTYAKGGRKAAKAVMDFMYKDARVWLDRKFERYCQYWPLQEEIPVVKLRKKSGTLQRESERKSRHKRLDTRNA